MLNVVNIVFLLFLTCTFGTSFKEKSSYPTIHDVITFKHPPLPNNEKLEQVSEMTIDIEKLDFHRLKKDDTAFRNQLMGGADGEVLLKLDNTRRIPYYRKPAEYFQAYEVQYRTKMADCMLQLIYMARSKIKSFAAVGHVDIQSSSYQIGFVQKKLEDLLFRARRYYITMAVKQNNRKWDTESTSILNLHHKVVMAHHDFMRLFYIQMRLHERYEMMEGHNIHSTGTTRATGTTL